VADVFGMVSNELTTSEVAVYTCPEGLVVDVGTVESVVASAAIRPTQTIVTSINVARFGAAATYSIYMTTDDTAPSGSTTDLVIRALSPASLNHSFSPGIVMSPGNTLWVTADNNSRIAMTINYIEVS